ncbi:hypothetical protein [Paenibacillus lactis]|uniref:hypothetical protein n=1 Tax=Paenibacillus lactis TaxID=228574 RepID=UPI0036908882
MERKVSMKKIPKGVAEWVFRPRRRYGRFPRIERMVELLFKAILIFWAFIVIRWFILITVATIRHFGVFD